MPDRRYQGDVILPSCQEKVYDKKVEKLWLLINTSASISEEALIDAFGETKEALEQIESPSGELPYFDTEVSEPLRFESIDDLPHSSPIGGGETSFESIFRFLPTHYHEDLPVAIIIITDGYAIFPP